jgi:DNA-binding IclR family transcriptional regulator
VAFRKTIDTPAAVAVLAVLRAAAGPLTADEIAARSHYATNTVRYMLRIAESAGLARHDSDAWPYRWHAIKPT